MDPLWQKTQEMQDNLNKEIRKSESFVVSLKGFIFMQIKMMLSAELELTLKDSVFLSDKAVTSSNIKNVVANTS